MLFFFLLLAATAMNNAAFDGSLQPEALMSAAWEPWDWRVALLGVGSLFLLTPGRKRLSALPGGLTASSVGTAQELETDAARTQTPPVLAHIPWLPHGQYTESFPPKIHATSETASGRAYQCLASTLVAMGDANPQLRCLLVSATHSGPCASWMLMNIAYQLCGAHQRVVLVDADFHHPTIHQSFNVDFSQALPFGERLNRVHEEMLRQPGKTPWLEKSFVDQESRGSLLTPEDLPGLSLLTNVTAAGKRKQTPGSYELLHSPALPLMLDALKEHFDWVLLDAGPFLQYAEPRTIARHTGGVLLLESPGASMETLLRIQEIVALNQSAIVGRVLRGEEAG